MARSIEIYTCVVVTAFLVEIIAIIIHGTPLALLAYAVTIVIVFTLIMFAINVNNRDTHAEGVDVTGNVEITEEEIEKRRRFLENILLSKVVDSDILIRSFPSNSNDIENGIEISSGNQSELNDDIKEENQLQFDHNENLAIDNNKVVVSEEREFVDIESLSSCPPCNNAIHITFPEENEKLSELESQICSICLSNKSIGDTIVYSKNDACNHTFHKECLILWFLAVMKKQNTDETTTNITSYTCPNCRCQFT